LFDKLIVWLLANFSSERGRSQQNLDQQESEP